MKKSYIAVVAMVAILCITGCSKNEKKNVSTTQSIGETTTAEETTKEPPTEPADPVIAENIDTPLNEFTLDVTLDTDNHKLVVKQQLEYNNKTGKDLNEIYFNLIPQAFTQDGGGTNIISITTADGNCSLTQVDGTVYSVGLPKVLQSGKMTKLDMNYEVNIPAITNRLGYDGSVFNLGNFIATPAVYDSDGWSVDSYIDLGDAFYTDIADYNVTIHVPDGYKVAAPGKTGENTYVCKNVRDFAFCASNKYDVMSDEWDGIKIDLYYGDNAKQTAERVMKVAKRSLEVFSKSYGRYPYSSLTISMNGLTGGVGGMEYPNFIMISPEFYFEQLDEFFGDEINDEVISQVKRGIDCTTCHEIAHQWFYGIVGNNQNREPWLDESFCRFSEYVYEDAYPPDYTQLKYETLQNDYEWRIDILKGNDPDITDKTYYQASLKQWMDNDPMGYYDIYTKGAGMLYHMSQVMGKDAFLEATREYINKYAYHFVTTEEFREFWKTKGDFDELFTLYFNTCDWN